MAESHTCKILTCLTLLFCFSANAFAQDLEILSKRPPVVKTFDHNKNESTIHGFLFNPDALQNLFDPNRPQPNMRLHSASYTYPGTTKSRPQSVTFVIQPLNKQQAAPHFSFTADSAVVLEGDATLTELCCVEIYGRSHYKSSHCRHGAHRNLRAHDAGQENRIEINFEKRQSFL